MESSVPEIPDTVDELLSLIGDKGSTPGYFWALTVDGEAVAEAEFFLIENKGVAEAPVHTPGASTHWRVVIEELGIDRTKEWENGTITVQLGDKITLLYHLMETEEDDDE